MLLNKVSLGDTEVIIQKDSKEIAVISPKKTKTDWKALLKASEKAGEIYRDTRIKIQVPDYITAASALELGAEVVILNIKHFQHIPALSLYPL